MCREAACLSFLIYGPCLCKKVYRGMAVGTNTFPSPLSEQALTIRHNTASNVQQVSMEISQCSE